MTDVLEVLKNGTCRPKRIIFIVYVRIDLPLDKLKNMTRKREFTSMQPNIRLKRVSARDKVSLDIHSIWDTVI